MDLRKFNARYTRTHAVHSVAHRCFLCICGNLSARGDLLYSIGKSKVNNDNFQIFCPFYMDKIYHFTELF